MIIDAHQHFWDPRLADYPWMTGTAAPLKRVYAPADLRPEMQRAGVSATVLVQTRSSLDETREFLHLAAREDFIAGVVGWVDLTDAKVADTIADLQRGEHGGWLVGVRHQVHDEPDADWLLRSDVQRGLAAVQAAGLSYDLLVRSRELPAALETVATFASLRFVVDHSAKPDIAGRVMEPWSSLIGAFAPHRSHVWCKLSGLVTEADWLHWTEDDLAGFVKHVLAVFGPERCIYGSDWPVCTLAASYTRVLDAMKSQLAGLDDAARQQIFHASATAAYGLTARLPEGLVQPTRSAR